MSTIASPRPSLTLSSRRTSTSTNAERSSSIRPARRNRAALREFYNLQPTTDQTPSSPNLSAPSSPVSELDAPSFSASAHVHTLLANESLENVLRAETALQSEIRGLDGEKKALVYDNYSKLIGATDTIRKMRERMEPSKPLIGTLGMAVRHIAATAGALSGVGKGGESESLEDENERKREVVRWVLAAPGRWRDMVDQGKRAEAQKEWEVVRGLLDKWEGTAGVEEVMRECEEVMGGVSDT